MTKRIFSGAQPTGNVHLGNYLGALRNWVALQQEYESFFCIVNLHAITVPQDPAQLVEKTRDLARIYLAVGIDPQVSTVFIQSDVKEHAELTWVLNCVARMSELERMTQYKDKAKGKGQNVSVGLFTYPILMAADILLYDTEVVPVGEDQKQHVELARDLAQRFNSQFGETFIVPQPLIRKEGARIMGLDDASKKMSKSASSPKNYISLLDDEAIIRKKIKSAVTDSGTGIKFEDSRPALANLLTIYSLISKKPIKQIELDYVGKGYADFKADLAELIVLWILPLQAKIKGYLDNKDELVKILVAGAEKARARAEHRMKAVRGKIGVTL